jgi:elongator complex protein 1
MAVIPFFLTLDHILLTPFKYQNVPPPMSSFKIPLMATASHVSFKPEESGSDFCVLLDNQHCQLFKHAEATKSPSLYATIDLKPPSELIYRQLSWLNPTTLVCIAHHKVDRIDSITIFNLSHDTADIKVESVSHIHVNYNLLVCLTVTQDSRVLCQDIEGQVFEILVKEKSCVSRMSFPTMCPWISSFRIGNEEIVYAGLNNRNKFYINNQLISSECTSFAVHDQYLILTTLSHTARFLDRKLCLDAFKVSDKEPSAMDEKIRRVEMGSKIVAVTPGDIKLVLQMPRGNLETVYPRALVLSRVRSDLANLKFREAFLACRKNRIDLNLMIDFDPALFSKHSLDVLKQIDEPDFINLLISSLRNEDVTKTMYSLGDALSETAYIDKVNPVCRMLREALELIHPDRYLNSILTTYAKQSPPDLESAMRRIFKLKQTKSVEAAEQALKYLIFLADVNKLYDVALGMYDFPLVLMVAQHSQKVHLVYIYM